MMWRVSGAGLFETHGDGGNPVNIAVRLADDLSIFELLRAEYDRSICTTSLFISPVLLAGALSIFEPLRIECDPSIIHDVPLR
jgi:hypothetical protein